MSIATRGASSMVGDEGSGGEGLDRQSARVSGAGASSMRLERGVEDMLVERMMMGNEMERMAVGCLL